MGVDKRLMESTTAIKQWHLICKSAKLKKCMNINVKTFFGLYSSNRKKK